MRCIGEIERLDALLASFGPAETALRLRLGQVLELLCSEGRGGHFELGFSSVAAYALERCDRSVRWVEGARCLARRLEQLPELRRAMTLGVMCGGACWSVSWSMGELLARVAQPQDERRWIEAAQSRTVREMQGSVLEAMRAGDAEAGVRVAGSVIPDAGAAGDVMRDGRVAGSIIRGAGAAGNVMRDAGAAGNVMRDAGAAGNVMPNEGAAGNTGSDICVRALVRESVANAEDTAEADSEALCTLTCTVDQEDAWLFEATRALLEQLGTHGAEAQVEALLAEGQGTLLAELPADTLDMDRLEGMDTAQRRWLEELARWRAEAEARCEEHIRDAVLGNGKPVPVQGAVAVAAALGMASLDRLGCRELDGRVRDLSRLLARHELELSRCILAFHRADGWRRLAYASEAQYARERLGMSRSSLAARRALALRLETLPRVAEALGAGQIGVEAASQVVRVAAPSTEVAWVERAAKRTIKLLREEVAAALTAVRLSGEAECPPPVDAEMMAFHALEQAVVSGRACQPRPANNGQVDQVEGNVDDAGSREQGGAVDVAHAVSPHALFAEPPSEPRRAWLVMLASLTRWLEGGLRMSAAQGSSNPTSVGSSAGRIVLRLRVSRANYTWWRGLEAQARRWLPRGMSWLRFLCLSLWQAWRHLLGCDVGYGRIYIRDGHRCMVPVCNRRDVTPHHLQFRSAGGSDEDENMASGCSWCHLQGIHGGRIRATGRADCIRWELGPASCPCLVVNGRERVAA